MWLCTMICYYNLFDRLWDIYTPIFDKDLQLSIPVWVPVLSISFCHWCVMAYFIVMIYTSAASLNKNRADHKLKSFVRSWLSVQLSSQRGCWFGTRRVSVTLLPWLCTISNHPTETRMLYHASKRLTYVWWVGEMSCVRWVKIKNYWRGWGRSSERCYCLIVWG
jgi:hypothetical protein